MSTDRDQAIVDQWAAELATGLAFDRAAHAREGFVTGLAERGRMPYSPAQIAGMVRAVTAGVQRLMAEAPAWDRWGMVAAMLLQAVTATTSDGAVAALWRAGAEAVCAGFQDAALTAIDRPLVRDRDYVRRIGDDPARLIALWVAIQGIVDAVEAVRGGTRSTVGGLGWVPARLAAAHGLDVDALMGVRRAQPGDAAASRARGQALLAAAAAKIEAAEAARAAEATPAPAEAPAATGFTGAPVDRADVRVGDLAHGDDLRAPMAVLHTGPALVLVDGDGEELCTRGRGLTFRRPLAPAGVRGPLVARHLVRRGDIAWFPGDRVALEVVGASEGLGLVLREPAGTELLVPGTGWVFARPSADID